MRSLTIAVVFVLLVLCPFATSGKPVGNKEKKPLSTFEKYAKLTSKVKAVRLEATLWAVKEKNRETSGKISLVGDKKTDRYAFEIEITRTRRGRVSTKSVACIHAAGETIRWRTSNGKLESAWKRKQAKDAKLPSYVDDLEQLCFIYDGLYGYKLLSKEITLKPENPPGHKKDDLTWYLASAVKHKKPSEFQKRMPLENTSLWLGFSPKDGWIHGLVFKENTNKDTSVFDITKLDLKPNLKGAFNVPADVKAKLDEEEKDMVREADPKK